MVPIPLIGTWGDDEWQLVIDGESLGLLPQLEEYYWVLDRPPYALYDKIGLRRLVKRGEEPIGVIFIFPGTWSSGEPNKIFLAGESFGGMAAMNYASKHWES